MISDLNIFQSSLYSNAFHLFSSFVVRYHILQPHNYTVYDKIISLK